MQVVSVSVSPSRSFLQQDGASSTTQQTYIYDVEDVDDGEVQTFVYPTNNAPLDPRETYYVVSDQDEGLYQVFNYTDASGYVQSVTP